jgi:hypothetical protein
MHAAKVAMLRQFIIPIKSLNQPLVVVVAIVNIVV